MAEQGQRRLYWVVAAVIVLAVAVGVGWWLLREPKENGYFEQTPISEADALRFIGLKNLGIAHLENRRFDEAADVFATLAKELPDERLGHRNLAITRVLQLKDAFEEKPGPETQQHIEQARKNAAAALDKLKAAETDSAVPHLLAARFYGELAEKDLLQPDHRERQVAELSQAVKIDGKQAHLWYELSAAETFSGDPKIRQRAAESIWRAYELRPTNLVLIRERLLSQARARDPKIVATLQAARKTVRPLAPGVLKRSGQYDLLKMIDDALAAAKGKTDADWQKVVGQVAGFTNVLKGEHASRLDGRELAPHEMEFIIADFSPKFYERAKLPPPKMPPGIEVALKPVAGPKALPPLANVNAVKLVDFDLDGRTDVIVAHGRRIEVYGLPETAKSWQLIAEIELPFEVTGIKAADLDYDVPGPVAVNPEGPVEAVKPKHARKDQQAGSSCVSADVDLVAFGPGGIVTLRNDVDPKTQKRTLTVVKQSETFQKLKNVLAVGVGDLDHDSDLDLVVSTQQGITLWMNRGDMTFEDATPYSTLPPADFKPSSVVPIDFDRNVHLDVVLADPKSAAAGYLQNMRHGQFRFKPFDKDFAAMAGARALAPIEADGNVSWDWVAAGPRGITLTRTHTVGNGGYTFLKSATIHESAVDGVLTWDYDNDGYQDLLAWGKNGFVVYRGGPDGQFQAVQDLFQPAPKAVTAADAADVDGDGDLDVVAVVDGKLTWYDNAGGYKNNWVAISLHAHDDAKFKEQRCNIHGVGSLLELKAGTMYQARIVTDPVTHFGLGERKQADVIRVLWTNGIPQNELQPAARQSICSLQKLLTGSCPYLYTWTGSKFEFFTDCLWAAPIGLQFADGVLAPSREWEYLRIPGERLAPIDGEYRLQITEELWEAAYFDSVKLIAIDHPADVDVYSNEKVGPASIARFKIHTVRHPRLPVAARDQTGRDVLPLLAREDGRYVQAYRSRIVQGLTPEHYLELDLGKLGPMSPFAPRNDARSRSERRRRITLFLTGWVFPSTTSVNVWLSHHPRLPAPQPPSLWVPDKNGRWRNVIPYMGFPGGKTKTIAVDLTNAFLTDDYRVRIKTTMEFRWDAAFFTVDEEPAEVRTTEIPLQRADLFYRGFSQRIYRPFNAPETYDHSQTDPAPHWPPMDGRFTRYGDVTGLLRGDDDRLVVMGAGDAMTLRFKVPAKPLPSGWKRDFFLRNVGWDKDADLNTVLGASSEPLPFRAMKSYPFGPVERVPDSPVYREYLRKYQTRRQPAWRFWRGMSGHRQEGNTSR
jgi:FG-GAP-like repeat